jgi:hypothetical protein
MLQMMRRGGLNQGASSYRIFPFPAPDHWGWMLMQLVSPSAPALVTFSAFTGDSDDTLPRSTLRVRPKKGPHPLTGVRPEKTRMFDVALAL